MYLRDGKNPFDSMNEECGVFGVYSAETRDVAHTVYYGLYALQHRGQESGGIAVAYANKIQYYKGMGLIPEIFANGNLDTLPEGDIAIGHVRYSTTGASLLLNAQPIVFTGKCGKMALAHNGNLTNTKQLREELINDNAVFQTTIDSEVMALLINKNSYGDIVKGVLAAWQPFQGILCARRHDGGSNDRRAAILTGSAARDGQESRRRRHRERNVRARRRGLPIMCATSGRAKFWSSIPRASIRIFWKARAESAPPVSSNTCISRARQRSGRLQRVRIEKRGRAAARQI